MKCYHVCMEDRREHSDMEFIGSESNKFLIMGLCVCFFWQVGMGGMFTDSQYICFFFLFPPGLGNLNVI